MHTWYLGPDYRYHAVTMDNDNPVVTCGDMMQSLGLLQGEGRSIRTLKVYDLCPDCYHDLLTKYPKK